MHVISSLIDRLNLTLATKIIVSIVGGILCPIGIGITLVAFDVSIWFASILIVASGVSPSVILYLLWREFFLLRSHALKDHLTDLWNRRGAIEIFKTLMYLFHRDHPKSPDRSHHVSALVLDVDFFKKVNDCLGHKKGDEILKRLAVVLQSTFHRSNDIICRFGGEEFIAIMTRTALPTAASKAEEVRLAIENHFKDDEELRRHSIRLTASFGVASKLFTESDIRASTISMAGDDPLSRLLHQADIGLDASKRSGRNSTTVVLNSREGGHDVLTTLKQI